MVPQGYEFSFIEKKYIIFSNYDNNKPYVICKYFALNQYGKPATGICSYGIIEGALITITFENGWQVGEVIVND